MNVRNGNIALVVDDNMANVFVLATMLKKLGFEVDEATSGIEAINYSGEKEYDLILMDHLMPDMDGIETIKQILFIQKGEKKPVIFGITATVDEDVVNAFHEVGASDILEKPVTLENMKEKLQEWDLVDRVVQEERFDASEQHVDSILSKVKGLEYKKGLELLAGSVENYMKVLSVCVRNIDDNYESLEALRGTSQLDGFALHFHSLKGIFLNIGADGLAEESRQLEMASKEERLEEVQEKTDGYMEKVFLFNSQLKKACDAYTQLNKQKYAGEEVSGSELAAQLDELKEHILDFEYIEITESLDRLQGSLQGEQKQRLDEITEAIQEFDYDTALEIVDQLKEMI